LSGRLRTSLITNPSNGRLPALTPSARARAAALAAENRQHPADGPENRSLQERCLAFNAGPPILPGPYNNYLQISQFPNYVVLFTEMIHDARIVPIGDAGPIRLNGPRWLGEPRGHWEGKTLVVDTVGVVPQAYIAISEAAGVPNNGDMRIKERIYLAARDILHVDLEIIAPKVLTAPWKTTRIYFRQRARKFDIVEGVCLEGYFKEGVDKDGNAIYVPPPPHMLGDLLREFEKYIHAGNGLPKLIRGGLLHVQFETIHPYLDGNGRIGRLLITLLLEHWGLLKAPLLYLSLYFKRNRDEYYRRLNLVRTEGDWEGWTEYFLDGLATIADEAVASARDLFTLVGTNRASVLAFKTTSVSAVRLFELLPRHPVLTVATAVKLIGASKPTATRAIETLVDAGILVETTGKKRDRSFAYQAYLDRLRVGTDLELPR
jgi:hypothetical protein